MGLELLFLLLPIAALSGWWVGRNGTSEAKSRPELSRDYFRGLNYLLNEQPDKAIEVFVHMLEVDSETVDTHFALGNLFRRRGEVDRAIRIHQNLIARPTLTPAQRNQALYELGRDYLGAGLLDRAENLFKELVPDSEYGPRVLQQLLDIYQQEKEWESAISTASRLQSTTGVRMQRMVAHFYCELAEQAVQKGEYASGMRLLRRALGEDRNCVRASLLEGHLESKQGNPKAAIRAFKRVEQQDPEFLSEIIEPLQKAHADLGRPQELTHYLRQLLRNHASATVLLALSESVRQQQGDADASALITGYLAKHPSMWGMERLIQLKLGRSQGQVREDLNILADLTTKLLAQKPKYQCRSCGFSGRSLYWQCPGCRQWNTTKPIHGIEGE